MLSRKRSWPADSVISLRTLRLCAQQKNHHAQRRRVRRENAETRLFFEAVLTSLWVRLTYRRSEGEFTAWRIDPEHQRQGGS
jgi:hypothetical protein